MTPTIPAFKEWAVICRELGAGRQSLILRKGGIAEGRDGFRFKEAEFALFPTLFHEQISRTTLDAATPIPDFPESGRIPIELVARVEFAVEITDWEVVLALEPFHVWKREIIEQRFDYDTKSSLNLAAVRIHKYQPAWSVEDLPKFGGCRSWVEIPLPERPAETIPVLADDEHQERMGRIKEILGSSLVK